MATRGLAHLLGRGAGKLKAERIRAFLEALRIQDIPKDNRLLEQARVYSEKHRIDLEVRFHADDGARRVVLVEAKFGHKLTKGQLSAYYTARQGYDRDCRIVGLTSDAGGGMHHKQVANWSVVLWRDLWRRFEKNRPHEADGQLAAFMAWLWQRIGGLSPTNSNSR
ncbi:MAG: PD-(D/E)XK nuclease family protein [Gammaproteobacteria bacterium]|nr:PD-(D/E)XK nuclease family protein [Gammaproteobacteria bacterium]